MRNQVQAPLLRRIEKFLQETGMRPSRLSREAVGDSTAIQRIRSGKATLNTCHRVMRWLDREAARRRNEKRTRAHKGT